MKIICIISKWIIENANIFNRIKLNIYSMRTNVIELKLNGYEINECYM